MTRSITTLLFLLHLAITTSLSHPLPAYTLQTLTPRRAFQSLLALPRPPIRQQLVADRVVLTLTDSRLSQSHRVRVRASLTPPARLLRVRVTPLCDVDGEDVVCGETFERSARLMAAVDSGARVSVSVDVADGSPSAIRLSLPALVPVLRREVSGCHGRRTCLARKVRGRCGRGVAMGKLQDVLEGRCRGECVVEAVRGCVGEGRGFVGVRVVAGWVLGAACAGVVAMFLVGGVVAVALLPAEGVRAMKELAEKMRKGDWRFAEMRAWEGEGLSQG